MKTKKHILLAVMTLLLISLLTACGGSADEPVISDANAVLTQAAEIAIQGLTQTAAAAPPTSTPMPVPATNTPPAASPTAATIPTNALLVSPTLDPALPSPTAAQLAIASPTAPPLATAAPVIQPTAPPISGDINCYKASFGSESAPFDNTKIIAGKSFTKTWRIKNTGTCPWTRQIDAVWVSTTLDGKEVGELMGASSVISFVPEEGIQPQQFGEITATFTVPEKPGVYQMFFMLRSPAGVFYIDGGALWFIIEGLPSD